MPDEQVQRFTRSARNELHAELVQLIISDEETRSGIGQYDVDQAHRKANKLIDAFTRELAEQQRDWLVSQGYQAGCVCGACSWCLAQEYIDLLGSQVRS